jgi:hypothetical protein
LKQFSVSVDDGKLLLRVKKAVLDLATDTALRRLDAAAATLGLSAETKTT